MVKIGIVGIGFMGMTHYRAAPRGLKPLVKWLSEYQAFWVDRIEKLKTLLEEGDE